jgi:hypothetical protein
MNKWLKIVLWFLFINGVGILIYLSNDAISKKPLEEPEIVIHVDGENIFIT